ncbi:hypothetical protein O3M35_004650 [Rhynocoris fuscipes]|uniref:Cortactin-binding protein-2 N-terminal domain-containing protein n=1 Tax=Rhynocoris fuscipes TaxID=488301 RepID=A0AAW1CLE8_9HEMI
MASIGNLTKCNQGADDGDKEKPHYTQSEKTVSNTLKRNPKMELSKGDLLKLLSYLEGELQARDIVIATLKCEKLKQMVRGGQYKESSLSDPICALERDGWAAPGSRQETSAQSDNILHHHHLHHIASSSNQRTYLDNLVLHHRNAHLRIANILRDAEIRHRKVIEELIMEKKKHEHDTAQGDDITYGLEKERTKLKQDLEVERQAKKRLEKDLKKISDISDEDKNRQKQIVLLLLAERKKIVMKYIEERKRSEDLAQILSEEKSRIDSMAEGLEEESKKSLQMEAELEKQLAHFDTESQLLRSNLMKEEKRVKELQAELEKLKAETAILEKQLAESQRAQQQTSPQQYLHQSRLPAQGWVEGSSAMGSLAKVVQPTATVSSVPVSAPTTGVARSISPGHSLRGATYSPSLQPTKVDTKRMTPVRASGTVACSSARPAAANGPSAAIVAPPSINLQSVVQQSCQPTGLNDKRPTSQSTVVSSASGNIVTASSRGAPPPVPPNKPVVPPKKDSVLAVRRGTAVTLPVAAVTTSERIQDTSAINQQVTTSDSYQNLPPTSHQSPTEIL